MIKNIQKAKKPMMLKSTGGSMEVSRIADIRENLHLIWFSEKTIANILSLKDAIALYQVTYNSGDKVFIVH